MSIFVVRHAKAGSRHEWDGDDDTERPLTKPGRRQAAALAARLAGEQVTGLWSSPSVRCVQTIEPLAEVLGLDIVTDPRLAEGAALTGILELFHDLPDGAVLCSHGDVIPDLLDALVRRGAHVTTAPDWRKAAVWVLAAPDADGHVASAAAEPPPD
ncbi:MAG TPA: phosphoglycerate mutase family protein [Ilumatobacteraceae bacterium]|nr:phosphoglycerate mutase family protein [Ilumatobacteraceae bacterium]